MLLARVTGSATVRSPAPAFLSAFARRIETGLLPAGRRSRNRYEVTRTAPGRIAFRATDWSTALNVGLNDVDIAISTDGTARYAIEYSRWAWYVVGLGGVIGTTMIATLLAFDIRGYLARHPASRFSRLSIDQNVAIAWAMALFWGYVWPWILIALHKRPLTRLMGRIIAEVDASTAR